MNPYAPVYTSKQEESLKRGREQVLRRWRASPLSDGQPAEYTVLVRDRMVLNEGDPCEEFIVRGSTPALSAAWERELAAINCKAEHHGKGTFSVFVPQATLIARGRPWFPCSVDGRCCTSAAVNVLLAGGMLALAVIFSG